MESRLGEPEVYNNPKALERALDGSKTARRVQVAGRLELRIQRVRELLRGLGLPEPDFDKPISALSGGQKKLIGLARLLLARPSVLLLDEPDNHLDLPGKAYLEKLIHDYPGAVVIISHDRYLLDACVTHIAEIEDGRISTFIGNYTEYIVDKEERLARQEELFQIQQREIGRLEMALKRYKQWVVFNDKFATRIHNMEARIERIEKIDRPVLERRKMGLELNGWRGSNQVLEFVECEQILFPPQHPGGDQFPDPARGAGGTDRRERRREIGAAAVDPGREQPTSGEIKIGPSVKVGYYAQEHETLDFNQTVIDAVRLAGNMSEFECRLPADPLPVHLPTGHAEDRFAFRR